jgi:hypothetical protein
MRMLVVDDDADVRGLLVRALERDGHTVRAVGTVAEARAELNHGGTDVMVLDLALPDGTGLDLCRRLRDSDDAPAILMLTPLRPHRGYGRVGWEMERTLLGVSIPWEVGRACSAGDALGPGSCALFASHRPSSFYVLSLLAGLIVGCGEDAEEDASVVVDAGLDASRPSRYEVTLAPVTSPDASEFIAVPHEVSLLDQLGNQLTPRVVTTSGEDGRVSLDLPANADSVYVVGVGPIEESTSTYDTVLVSNNWESGDKLLRISSRATLDLTAATAAFKVREDRASMTGAVYWTKNRVRQGPIGCAKIYIDGASAPDEDQVQRYVNETLLPVPLAAQGQTTRLGRFYFGNLKVGVHSIRVSLDDRQTTLAEKSFFVGRTRAGAQSPTKSILYQFAVDIEAEVDPTPVSCP